MALTSVYYDGAVTETDRAKHLAGAPEYGVYGPEDFKVTAHPSIANAVLVKAGRAHGHGVTDIAAEDQVVNCTPLSAGQVRWDLIVVRRNWQPNLGGPSTLVAIHAGANPAIPAQRKVGPGIEDDQPLFFVKWQGGVSAPVDFVDARAWAANGGLVANHDIVRTYMSGAGTRIHISGIDWVRRVGANGSLEWVSPSPRAGEAYVVTSKLYSTGRIVFNPPFPTQCSGVALSNSTPSLNVVNFKIIDRTPSYVEFVAYNKDGNGLPESGLYINYVAGGI